MPKSPFATETKMSCVNNIPNDGNQISHENVMLEFDPPSSAFFFAPQGKERMLTLNFDSKVIHAPITRRLGGTASRQSCGVLAEARAKLPILPFPTEIKMTC